jgi:biopolymer transport protein ExbD
MFFEKNVRREIIPLNLVALIDISAMIIIFLVMGAIFGESSVVIPKEMFLPKSVNKETLENAPQVILSGNKVIAYFIGEEISLEEFHQGQVSEKHKDSVKRYLAAISPKVKKAGVLLNFVADQSTPYRDVFDVIRFYREIGFHSVLFVARGK